MTGGNCMEMPGAGGYGIGQAGPCAQAADNPPRLRRPTANDSLRNIFANTLQHFGLQQVQALRLDQFGGCLNVRPRRGGNTYSVHAWGAAVDLDPVNNALRWDRSRAACAKAAYEPFWKIVEEQGWTSLGRQKDYDWMHFQAASL